MSTLIYPRSRGTLRLASDDPTAAPLIDMNYLAEAEDAQVLCEGVEMVREIMKSAAFGTNVESELHPGTLYGAIKRLLEAGLVEECGERAPAGDERRRYYRLTGVGHRAVAAEMFRLQQLVDFARGHLQRAGASA